MVVWCIVRRGAQELWERMGEHFAGGWISAIVKAREGVNFICF